MASEAFGEIYVVPMDATLRDIEQQLRIWKVSLLTRDDMNAWNYKRSGSESIDVAAVDPGLRHKKSRERRDSGQDTNSRSSCLGDPVNILC